MTLTAVNQQPLPNCCKTAPTLKKLYHATQTAVNQHSYWKVFAHDPNLSNQGITLKRLCTWPKPLWISNCTEKALHVTQTAVNQQSQTKVLQMTYSFVNWWSHWKGSACDPNHCEPVITCWQRFSKWPTAFWTSNCTEKALHVTQTSELVFSKWPKPLWNSPAIVLHCPYGEDAPLPIPQ